MAPSITKILVPTDFSETADAALDYAKTLAATLGASLHLVHVFRDVYTFESYVPEVYVPPSPELRKRALADANAALLNRLEATEEQRFAGSREIIFGLAAKQIVKYADDHDIDLIVMGTHGRRGFAHLLLGSVAEHVVRTAVCPVLTVGHVAAHEQAKAIGTARVA